MKILIADDDDLAIKILRRYLVQWGHEVVEAYNGEEAWTLFQSGEFPIVISDWMMPVTDGLELIRRIKCAARPGYVYTILITARAGKDDLVKGMEAGADDFVCKPFDRDELRVRLREGERIIALEQKLADAESCRDQELRSLITRSVDAADVDLASVRASLSAVEGVGDAIERLDHAQGVLHALKGQATPVPRT